MMRRLKLTVCFLFIVVSAWTFHSCLPTLIQWTQSLGVYAVVGFCLLYCGAALLFLPVEPIVLACGALFGFSCGFMISLFSAVLSAALAFMISRYFKPSLLLGKNTQKITHWFSRSELVGWKALALSRLTPFIPCSVVNYGYGLTNMKLWVYTSTSLVFFIPYKLAICYFGTYL